MAQTVKVNWQQNAPFGDYKTYQWKTLANAQNDFYTQWVMPDVDAQLSTKGLTKVSPGQRADLIVSYHLATLEVKDSTTTTDGFGWGPGPWGWWGGWAGEQDLTTFSSTTQRPRFMGILTVDLADSSRKQLVWRGQATVDSISNSEKGDEKQTEKCVEKMFKKYPPK
ncbi:MAG TPA: DUF4136 domain-containing protein [Terriglobales bacterium]|nr:DUF4136 domain-containing protein [Terriglobales bacterium]